MCATIRLGVAPEQTSGRLFSIASCAGQEALKPLKIRRERVGTRLCRAPRFATPKLRVGISVPPVVGRSRGLPETRFRPRMRGYGVDPASYGWFAPARMKACPGSILSRKRLGRLSAWLGLAALACQFLLPALHPAHDPVVLAAAGAGQVPAWRADLPRHGGDAAADESRGCLVCRTASVLKATVVPASVPLDLAPLVAGIGPGRLPGEQLPAEACAAPPRAPPASC